MDTEQQVTEQPDPAPTETPAPEIVAPITATPEQRPTPEVVIARQKTEVRLVTNNILYRRGDEVKDKPRGELSNEQKSFQFFTLVSQAKDGSYIQDSHPNGLDLDQGQNKVIVNINGEDKQIRSIQKIEGDTYTCVVKDSDGQGAETVQTVSREQVTFAHLKAEQVAILASLSDSERKVVALRIQELEGNDDAITEDKREEINKVIVEAAKASGMLLTEDIRTFVDKVAPQHNSPEGGQLTDEQKVQNELRESLLQAIDGKNIADYAVLSTIIEKANVVPQMQEALVQLEEALKANPADETVKNRVALLKNALKSYQDGKVEEYFTAIQEGRISQERAQQVREAFQAGKIDQAIYALVPELAPDPSDSPEVAAKKEAQRLSLAETAKGAGIFALILIALVGLTAQAVVNVTGTVTK